MALKRRQRSESGYYHVVLKGNQGNKIFRHRRQKEFLFENLKRHEELLEVTTWCVMDNHVHLIVIVDYDEISKIFHSVNLRFAKRDNKINQGSGHVFQSRFWSDPIDSEDHLLRAIRYIHNNPVKAGLVDHPHEWEWSSYSKYRDGKCTDVMRYAYDLMGGAPRWIERFHGYTDPAFKLRDTFEDVQMMKTLYADYVKSVLCSQYRIKTWGSDTVCREAMVEAVKLLTEYGGFSIREIADDLGVPFSCVQRIQKLLR